MRDGLRFVVGLEEHCDLLSEVEVLLAVEHEIMFGVLADLLAFVVHWYAI